MARAGGYIAERRGYFFLADNTGIGSCDVFVWTPAPSGCCGDCAATGDAKSSAAINASFFIFAIRFALVHHRPAMRAATIAPERVHRRRGFSRGSDTILQMKIL